MTIDIQASLDKDVILVEGIRNADLARFAFDSGYGAFAPMGVAGALRHILTRTGQDVTTSDERNRLSSDDHTWTAPDGGGDHLIFGSGATRIHLVRDEEDWILVFQGLTSSSWARADSARSFLSRLMEAGDTDEEVGELHDALRRVVEWMSTAGLQPQWRVGGFGSTAAPRAVIDCTGDNPEQYEA